jgi:hypothetical protein
MKKSKPTSPCHSAACAIQACLTANGYQEDKCKDVINKLLKCCEKHRDTEDPACGGVYRKREATRSTESEKQ